MTSVIVPLQFVGQLHDVRPKTTQLLLGPRIWALVQRHPITLVSSQDNSQPSLGDVHESSFRRAPLTLCATADSVSRVASFNPSEELIHTFKQALLLVRVTAVVRKARSRRLHATQRDADVIDVDLRARKPGRRGTWMMSPGIASTVSASLSPPIEPDLYAARSDARATPALKWCRISPRMPGSQPRPPRDARSGAITTALRNTTQAEWSCNWPPCEIVALGSQCRRPTQIEFGSRPQLQGESSCRNI